MNEALPALTADPRLMPSSARAVPAEGAPGLADVLRERTRRLHTQAERTGIIRELVRGRSTRFGYGLYLRNLLPAYRQLERELQRRRRMPGLGALALPEVYRAAALTADLEALFGPLWARRLPLLPAGARYAREIAAADTGYGLGLIGYAYTRYLGDLSGGQILKRLLGKSLALEPRALSFYEFPMVEDLKAFKREYRRAIDAAGLLIAEPDPVIAAAEAAFRLNIEVSEAVMHAAAELDGGEARRE